MTVYTRKFSEFAGPVAYGGTDIAAGLHNGVNTQLNGFNTGGGGGGSVIAIITQVPGGPVLSLGEWVRINVQGVDAPAGAYVPALAVDAHQGERVGVVVALGPGVDQYSVQQSGYITDTSTLFPALIPGTPYFLDTSTPGNMVDTDVSIAGQDSLPCFIADSASSGWVVPYRGEIINGPAGSGGGGGGGTDSNIHVVNQPGNTFVVGDWVYVSGDTVYSKAIATALNTSQSVGVVTNAGNPQFTLQFSGFNSNTVTGAVDAVGAPIAITSGTTYYLSEITAGKICPTPPVASGSYSKPVYISESSTNITGYVLPQRPLAYAISIPDVSPWVFLGQLNDANNYSSTTILQDSLGNLYNRYELVLQSAVLGGARGIQATGAGNVGIGFQLYIGGAWLTTPGWYATLTGGTKADTAAMIATQWGYAALNVLAPYGVDNMVLLPRTSNNVGLVSGVISLENNSSAKVITFNIAANDYSLFPANRTLYVSVGTSTTSLIGQATGIRIYADNGSIVAGGATYISIFGVPNA